MRKLVGAVMVTLLALLASGHAWAGGQVPFALQAQLVTRLGSFDRHFAERAGPVARILVVSRSGDAGSRADGGAFAHALGEQHTMGGVPIAIEEAELADIPALAQRVRAQHVALVWFSSGLADDMPRIATAFAGVDVLTVGASAHHAEKGAVVGFDLEEARPKIVLNLKSAHAQTVDFKAELLKLARIVD